MHKLYRKYSSGSLNCPREIEGYCWELSFIVPQIQSCSLPMLDMIYAACGEHFFCRLRGTIAKSQLFTPLPYHGLGFQRTKIPSFTYVVTQVSFLSDGINNIIIYDKF